MAEKWVTVMGSFVADLAFRTGRIPAWGETLMGQSFQLGPGRQGLQPGCCRGARRRPGELHLQAGAGPLRGNGAQSL